MKKTDLPPHTLEKKPSVHHTVFIARGAQVLGDVRLAAYASVWYNCVLRGDINYIEIGERTNIQDGCILHLENDLPCIIEHDVTVGHGAILHGCHIEPGCLIGMGAIILSGAVVKRGSVVAAGALIRENSIVAPYSLMAGVPAKLVRTLDEDTYQKNLQWAAKYVKVAARHREKGFAIND
jgi:carbonic anhydrase/acetyltransferase-like protein (isoleucine patch superfamily)